MYLMSSRGISSAVLQVIRYEIMMFVQVSQTYLLPTKSITKDVKLIS